MKKRLAEFAKKIGEKAFRLNFGHRMLLIYLVGGLLPLAIIGAYLIHGTNQILVEQAQNSEILQLETISRQLLELQNTMTTMSQYFYFDDKLEEIAAKEYTDYQEMIDDFKSYTAFLDYQKYYNNIISRISVFLQNDTLKGNMDFVVVDEETHSQEWYKRVSQKGGGVVWTYLPYVTYGYDHALALTRMLKTKKGEEVGVLVIYIRPERFDEAIYECEGTAFITLNGEVVIAGKGDDVVYEAVQEFLPDGDVQEWQKRITIDEKQYVVTCENVRQDDTRDYLQIVSVRALSDILADANRQSWSSIYLCVISVILAVTIISLFTRAYGKRINRFREQMQKAASGNFELEKKLGGNDEISELYDYLNTMILDIQRLLAGIYQERIQAERLKTRQKDAEFKMLTSQINPHFLYNTLETIRMKARINGQYEIEELVKMLAKILRSNIQAGEKDVTIRSEVELVEYYLKIQQYRFGEKIQYQITVDEDVQEYLILPLILQPIVENAIVHGLEGRDGPGHISIVIHSTVRVEKKEAEREETESRKESQGRGQAVELLIHITDDGVGISAEKLSELQKDLQNTRLKGEHIGICNVQHRIRLKYGGDYGISIDSRLMEGTQVQIRLPGQEESQVQIRLPGQEKSQV